jgi:hypothetical protein
VLHYYAMFYLYSRSLVKTYAIIYNWFELSSLMQNIPKKLLYLFIEITTTN